MIPAVKTVDPILAGTGNQKDLISPSRVPEQYRNVAWLVRKLTSWFQAQINAEDGSGLSDHREGRDRAARAGIAQVPPLVDKDVTGLDLTRKPSH